MINFLEGGSLRCNNNQNKHEKDNIKSTRFLTREEKMPRGDVKLVFIFKGPYFWSCYLGGWGLGAWANREITCRITNSHLARNPQNLKEIQKFRQIFRDG